MGDQSAGQRLLVDDHDIWGEPIDCGPDPGHHRRRQRDDDVLPQESECRRASQPHRALPDLSQALIAEVRPDGKPLRLRRQQRTERLSVPGPGDYMAAIDKLLFHRHCGEDVSSQRRHHEQKPAHHAAAGVAMGSAANQSNTMVRNTVVVFASSQ